MADVGSELLGSCCELGSDGLFDSMSNASVGESVTLSSETSSSGSGSGTPTRKPGRNGGPGDGGEASPEDLRDIPPR